MPQKIPLQEIKTQIEKKYPDQLFDFSDYKNTNSKIKAIDPDYGEWYPTVKNLLSKQRKCTKRAFVERPSINIDIETVVERAKQIHNNEVVLDTTTYVNTNTKCKFIDKDFGEFWMLPHHVFNGSGHTKRGNLKQIQTRILPLDEVKKRLKEIHGDTIQIIGNTYTSTYKKALFVHEEHGEWWALPNNVIKKESSHPFGSVKRRMASCLRIYGAEHPMQNEFVFKKTIQSRWRTINLKHWKTNKNLVCMSSYEYAVITTLNNKKIDFDWQIKVVLPNDMIYFIDLYLIKQKQFIEIKGYFFNEKNKLKWELFHSITPNSDIWYEKEVVSFVDKSTYKIKKEFDDAYKNEIKRYME